jgi:hypothetical protein
MRKTFVKQVDGLTEGVWSLLRRRQANTAFADPNQPCTPFAEVCAASSIAVTSSTDAAPAPVLP